MPMYLHFIELVYSDEDKKALIKDENGRDLPEWLREAEERSLQTDMEQLPKKNKWMVLANYTVNYGVKALLIWLYF